MDWSEKIYATPESLKRIADDARAEGFTAGESSMRELAAGAGVETYNRAAVKAIIQHARLEAFAEAAVLHESINPASDSERLRGDPGADAMGAILEYRDAIRALKGAT